MEALFLKEDVGILIQIYTQIIVNWLLTDLLLQGALATEELFNRTLWPVKFSQLRISILAYLMTKQDRKYILRTSALLPFSRHSD